MTETRPARRGSGGLAAGFILIFLGSWFGLERLGVELPPLSALWPAFPFLGGCGLLLAFWSGRQTDPGVVWPGTAGVLVGLFFALFTLGIVDWYRMDQLWPVFPLIAGLAFLATWWASRRRPGGMLVAAAACMGVGVLGLAATFEILEDWLAPALEIFWPLALIAFGLYLVMRSLKRRDREV